MNISEKTIRKIAKTELNHYFRHANSAATHRPSKRTKTGLREDSFFKKMKACANTCEVIFSDENLFIVEATLNLQNDRVLAESSKVIPIP